VETRFFPNATVTGGATAIIAGGVLLSWALVNSAAAPDVYCFGASGAECGGTRFTTESVSIDAVGGEDPNRGSVPLAARGYSLIGTGAIWTLGTLLFTDEDEKPWLPLIAGLVVGGASLGLSVALDSDSPFAE
jgi:hypothetical protein